MYHKLSIKETIETLDVNPETGLSDKEARQRIARDEETSENSSFFKLAAKSFARPIIYMLLIAAAISAVFGGLYEALLILASVLVNVVFTAECKRRGTKSLENTINSSVIHAIVLRDGAKMKLSADELVVGDVVTIKPGRVVPADLRLISSEGLVIDESALTGEFSVKKNCDAVIPGDVDVEERSNCAFEGTVVTHGRGDGIVISTGMSTEMSRLTLPLDTPEKRAMPVFSRLHDITRTISLVISFACVAVFAVGVIRMQSFLEMIMLSLALAVAVLPESVFTASITALSRGAENLKKNGFSPKSMKAVEMLGEVTVLCTDIPKLGVAATYTNGRIRTPQEEDTIPFIDGLLLCQLKNTSLSVFASHKCDAEKVIKSFPKIGELSSEVSTTLHRAENTTISYTGGEPEEILARSSYIWEFGRIHEITESEREEILEVIASMREDGYSPTAIGLRSGDEVPCDTDLVFLGIAATHAADGDSTTPDTAKMRKLGVKVYLLTEQDAEKARLGAAALSLPCENMLSGREIRALDESGLRECLKNTFVFIGLSAQDKVKIIHALKSLGETVAAIGESLSDSPALDAADIGLADEHAKDAAKDASEIIYDSGISADNAIRHGKEIRSSMRKVLVYLVGANLAELVCVLLCLALGLGSPISPSQILLLNLLTDTVPALLIASSGGFVYRRNLTFSYAVGVLLGIVSVFMSEIFKGAFSNEVFASWATFGFIGFFELALAVPIYRAGKKNKNQLKKKKVIKSGKRNRT